MTGKEIQGLVEAHSHGHRKIWKDRKYALGENTEIYADPAKPDPDNRIPVPFARRAVMLTKGYIAKPGQINYSGDLYEALEDQINHKREQLRTAEEFENCLIHGITFEIHWFEEGRPYYAMCPQKQAVPIWSNDIEPRLVGFIRAYQDEQGNEIAVHYDDTVVETWIKRKSDKTYILEDDPQPHGYGTIPVNYYTIDSKQRNLFDHCIKLIDQYDKIVSQDVANELERFANAYLGLQFSIDDATRDDNGRTEVDRLKESRIFQNVPGKISEAIAYITKPTVDGFVDSALDRLERLIYEMLMLFNPNDDTFNAASGVAAQYKMLAFEYAASSYESYFSMGLQRRFELMASVLELPEDMNIEIKYTRNLPQNILELSQIAGNLKGILDDETIVRLFPSDVVADVNEVLERLNQQAAFDLFGGDDGQPQE